MKPLFLVVLCVTAVLCKELPKSKDLSLDTEASDPQTRAERCTTCGNGVRLNVHAPNNALASLKAAPGAEVHSQSFYEQCSSEKGCAGIKVKDGKIIQKYGDAESFKAAAAAESGNDFSFHAPGANGVFTGGIPKDGPFWWMNENSPFKAGASGGNFEKFSQSSSSYSTGGNANGANFGASLDLSGNPFLNGDFSKLAGQGLTSAGQSAAAFGQESSSFTKPASSFQSSSYESSSFSSKNGGEVDISKNPFLNGGYKQQGFGGQASFSSPSSSSQGYSSSNKFASSGYTGSSPSPFTASSGAQSNLIQNSQKATEFDFESQQQQQNIDEIFQETGNVHAHEHSGGELQQTCAGQGYVCVHKAQCNNGVVNTNGQGILQAKTKKQYCNIKTEICCRIEISSLQGAGGLQGSLGVGSATFSGGSGSSSQGSGLFTSSSQSGSNFGSGFNSAGSNSGSFDSSSSGSSSSFGAGSSQSGSAFGSETSGQRGSGFNGQGNNGFGSTSTSFESSSFESSNRGTNFGNGGNQFGASGQGSTFNSQGSGSQGTQGFNTQGQGNQFGSNGNRGVSSVETSSFESSSFESSSRGNGFNNNNNNNGNNVNNVNKFGTTGSGFSGTNYGATGSTTNRFGNTNNNFDNNNEVVKTTNTQTNFIETDSFSSGSDTAGVYRPGQTGLKPGVPYLPPVDNTNSGTNVVSSTAFTTTYGTTTPRPYTPKPYVPPSTSAPGYLPPEGEQTINTETRVPNPNYDEGQIILDETRQPRPKNPQQPIGAGSNISPVEIPAGCAAALKCTPVEFCTAEGVMSNTSVVLTRDQEAFRVPLTDCKDIETGRVGKCCRDPNYSDPWPTNLIGKWTQGVFGGNDGKYTPDNRGSPNNPTPSRVTARPTPAPITGSELLNNYRTTPRPVSPNSLGTTVSQGSYGQKGSFETRGQGQYSQGGQGQYSQGGQGQLSQGGQGFSGSQSQYSQSSFSQSQFGQKTNQFGQKGQGQAVSQGQGQVVSQGQGQLVSQGQGQVVSQGQGSRGQFGQGQLEIQEQGGQSAFASVQGSRGQGQFVSQGQGQLVSQGQGQIASQGQGQIVSQGQGQTVSQGQRGTFSQASASASRGQGQFVQQGQGQIVSQGVGQGVRQGQGFAVSQGSGFGVENEYSESVSRVFLSRYNGGGECGVFNGQKPYGNRNELEVDFAEIPWQAMVLLQTNKSLLCGGVITRPDVVVTSASCVEGLQAKNVLIKGGEWKLGIDDEPLPFQIVQVKHILRHPFYKSGSFQYDAAILVLTENLRLAKNIYPICLPGAQETLDAFYNGAGECIVTGWGKQVLQAHLAGAILHSLNISLINPGECQDKLSQDYPHLLEQYDQESCACGQPTNPINNICKVDTGSALACTTGDGHFVLRGVYSWDSGCQPGNQLAAFYKFDLEWYEWAIGLIESVRFAQFQSGSQITQSKFSSQIRGSQYGVKGGQAGGVKGSSSFSSSSSKGQYSQFGQGQAPFGQGQSQFGQGQAQFGQGQAQFGQGQFGQGQFGQGQFGQGQFGQGQFGQGQFGQFASKLQSGDAYSQQTKPIQGSNSFSASFSEKKVFQSEPQYVTYTTKPEIVTYTTKPEIYTYTTKPEIYTYTTKPKIVTFTTKPQIITYETSGSGTNPQYIAPGVTYNPTFDSIVGQHKHNAQCKCDGKK